tara:strand:- start:2673 stop:3587 length:915 start_codon:yes stop_codon:yes gene_type:complete
MTSAVDGITNTIASNVVDDLIDSVEVSSGGFIDLTLTGGFARDDSCIAHRMHQALVHLNFTEEAMVGELVTMRVFPFIGIFLSLFIACFGHKFLRPSMILLGFAVGSFSALHVFYEYADILHNWACDAIFIASLVCGGIVGLIASMLVHGVSMVMGAIAGAAVVTLFFDICESCNEPLWPNAATFLDKLLVPYWLSFAIVALIGACITRSKETRILAIVTSFIGGWGGAASVRLAVGSQKGRLPGWANLLVAAGFSALGFAIQSFLISRSQKAKERANKPPQIALVSAPQTNGVAALPVGAAVA